MLQEFKNQSELKFFLFHYNFQYFSFSASFSFFLFIQMIWKNICWLMCLHCKFTNITDATILNP